MSGERRAPKASSELRMLDWHFGIIPKGPRTQIVGFEAQILYYKRYLGPKGSLDP